MENNELSRLLKALPLTLAVAALSIVATSCGSSTQSQVRVINAVPNAPNNLDVYFNGAKIVTDIPFDAVSPTPSTPAAYTNVASGSIPIEAFTTGNTSTNSGAIVPANINANLVGAMPYTVVLDGYSTEAIAEAIEDFNTPPTTGYVEFRVINASPSGPTNGADVYFVPSGITDITDYAAQIPHLGNGQASTYQDLPFLASGYWMIVTVNGNKTPIATYAPSAAWPANGSITTLVLLDNPGGYNGMSPTPLVLQDLN